MTTFSRISVFLFSLILTGLGGGLLMIFNFHKKNKSGSTSLLILSSVLMQLIIWVTLFYFLQPPLYWSLNKTIGWGWHFADYLRAIPLPVIYFAINMLIGFILIFPIWKKCERINQWTAHKQQ